MKRLKDYREFIDELKKLDDIKEVNYDIDPNLEMAAYTRRSISLKAPAPIFNNVRGAQKGLRAMGAPASLCSNPEIPAARVAISVGLPATGTWTDIVQELAKARKAKAIPPVTVKTAPCKENILMGKDANLDIFPIPYLHEGDGGYYSNTWGSIIVRTPDGKWTSCSIARIQKLDSYSMTGLFMMPQHIACVWEEWVKIGKPMPFALVQGCEPAIPIVSSMPLERYINELDYLGGYYNEPIDVVKCETIDLEVPASSEIVIEGHVSIGRDALEGPFGEFPGYLAADTSMQPVYHVECITHRDNAIWPLVPEGRPIDEYHTAVGVALSAEALGVLRDDNNLPVTMVWSTLETANHWLIVTVPSDWREKLPNTSSEEFCRLIGEKIWPTKYGGHCPVIYLLDDDIDPTNSDDYLWALATRIHPTKHVYTSEGTILPLLTCFDAEERHNAKATRVVHDGLLPEPGHGRLKHSSFDEAYPKEIQERVLKNWNK